MSDMTEPWPPLPGNGRPDTSAAGTDPASISGTPPPPAPELPQAFPAPPDWTRPAAAAPPTLDAALAPEASLPADLVAAASAPVVPRRRRGGLVVVVALILVGLAGVLGGGVLLAKELTRKPTRAEQAAALAKEVASRWQRLPAGTIFPATISYQKADGSGVMMTRVGIVPPTSCQSALEPNAFQPLRSYGCVAMLRATYIDEVGTQAVTVGIAAFPSGIAAQGADGALQGATSGGGLYAVPITGTITNTFGNAQRATSGSQLAGPYVLLFTAGYTDGMPSSAATSNVQLQDMGNGLLTALEPILTKHTSPCTMKDIKC